MDLFECERHGEREVTLVCQHIAHAVDSGKEVGFYWSREDDNTFPDAWCKSCNLKLLENGGWDKNLFKKASFKIICSECYKEAKEKLLV